MHTPKPNYLKVWLNNECNFHCVFCRLKEGKCLLSDTKEKLTIEEMSKLVDGFVRSGVEHVRIIGAEPLLKRNLLDLIYFISSTKRLKQISLTTNGFYLKDKALALKGAGLNRININLASLDREKFRKITGVDGLNRVLEGICAAKEADLTPIRINIALIKGLNYDEIEDFAALSVLYPLEVRFIEYFPDNKFLADFRNSYVAGYMVKNDIEFSFGPLILDKKNPAEGPAIYYRIKGAKGRIGFINHVSEFFCMDCNTLILDNEGSLFSCLYSPSSINLSEYLRNNEFKILSERIHECFYNKHITSKDHIPDFFR